jgi:hypothetical protein
MSIRPRVLRATVLVVAAFVAALVCASGAAAEIAGEGDNPIVFETPGPLGTIVKATASYEKATGAVSFGVTLGGMPHEGAEAGAEVVLLTAPPLTGCNVFSFTEGFGGDLLFAVDDGYTEPTSTHFGDVAVGGSVEELGPAAKSVSGSTMSYSFTSAKLANQTWNCAYVNAGDAGGSGFMYFPLKQVVSPPPLTPTNPNSPEGGGSSGSSGSSSGPSVVAAAPAPAVLSVGKSVPLSLKAGKSRSVTVKVTNTGGTATARGTLRVKAPTGVVVKPASQGLPVLTPGGSCTVTVRVQLTKAAKPKSTLSLTASAPGVTGTGSLVAKLKKG